MNKKQVIVNLCELVSQLGVAFNHRYLHDCFCGENGMVNDDRYYQFDTVLLIHMGRAVREYIQNHPDIFNKEQK